MSVALTKREIWDLLGLNSRHAHSPLKSQVRENLLVPIGVKCRSCVIKGLVPACPRCEGTGRLPIPAAEVMSR